MSTTPFSRKSAFTLIELLVVIGIIALLAGLLMPALKGARDSAKKAKAQVAINSLGVAFRAFYNEYGLWPIPTGVSSDSSPITTNANGQASALYKILTGDRSELISTTVVSPAIAANPRGIVFLEFKSADLSGSGSTTNMIDPWGVPYQIVFDVDNDNDVSIYSSSTTKTGSFAIWSKGPDKTDSSSAGESVSPNSDNVTSWK